MDTKAAFEKWYAEFTSFREMLPGDKEIMFSSWTASRKAIEIEFPEEKPYKHNSYPEARAQDDGFNDALSECSAIITSHGIRIKGKTE